MDTIAKVREKLRRFPDARIEETETSITVRPPTHQGFPVGLYVREDHFEVYCEGWHEYFEDEEEAIRCFGFALSTACRLAVTLRGASATSWTLEYRDGDGWQPTSLTALIFVPFWRKKRVVYRYNSLLEAVRDPE